MITLFPRTNASLEYRPPPYKHWVYKPSAVNGLWASNKRQISSWSLSMLCTRVLLRPAMTVITNTKMW